MEYTVGGGGVISSSPVGTSAMAVPIIPLCIRSSLLVKSSTTFHSPVQKTMLGGIVLAA
jgi:hypothetical protein